MSATVEIIYVGNDMVLDVENVRNALTGIAISDADVQLTLRDQASNAMVSGESWPKTLAAVPGQPGRYRCTIPYTLSIAANQRLVAEIDIDAGPGLRATFEIAVVVKPRRV